MLDPHARKREESSGCDCSGLRGRHVRRQQSHFHPRFPRSSAVPSCRSSSRVLKHKRASRGRGALNRLHRLERIPSGCMHHRAADSVGSPPPCAGRYLPEWMRRDCGKIKKSRPAVLDNYPRILYLDPVLLVEGRRPVTSADGAGCGARGFGLVSRAPGRPRVTVRAHTRAPP
jgi:hypothetical protein